MGVFKRIGKSERLRGALCALAAGYIRLVYATGRWEHVGDERARSLKAEGRPMVVAFWHSRLLMMGQAWIGGPFHMLISQHRDGVLIARTVESFGFHTIAGSTTRGGAAAFRAILKVLKGGGSVGITPDGPRGPRQRASAGTIDIARLSGAVIMPLAYSARGRLLKSWDRFLLPLPFSRGVFLWGEPMEIARDSDTETCRIELESRLNALMAEADRRIGIGPVEAAP